MNIFATDRCPVKCAKYLDDKRVVKMVLETAQMLSTAINERGGTAPYKSTHKNHPCNIWIRESAHNYEWALQHFLALCKEYTKRYNKIHKSEQHYMQFVLGKKLIPCSPGTKFPNCARNKEKGIDYTQKTDVHMAYQLYLNDRWDTDARKPTWHGISK